MVETRDLLQECLERIEQGETPDQLLARYPDRHDELASLLGVIGAIQTRAADPMPAAAQARVRYQIQGAARTQQKAVRTPWSAWALRLAMTAILVLLLGGGGWAVEAQSKPGGSLFSLRIAIDEARAGVLADPQHSIPLRLQIAEDRLADVQILRAQGRLPAPVLFVLVGETESLITALEQFPEQTERVMLERALNLVRTERALLRDLAERAPTERVRGSVEGLLQISGTWEPVVQRLLEKSR